jgi:hypothetical protein
MASIVEKQELKTFIEDAMANRQAPHKRIAIGTVSENVQKYIEDHFGVRMGGIGIDNSGVFHAKRKAAHNLEPDDLLLAVDVINNSDVIELSKKIHAHCKVLEFKKDIDGEITFLAEIHEKDGYLLVFDAWRKKKARRYATADTDNAGTPSANALNASPLALTSSLSGTSAKKSSGENAL